MFTEFPFSTSVDTRALDRQSTKDAKKENSGRIKVVYGIGFPRSDIDAKRADTHVRTCVTLFCMAAPN
jgi:hypothetical protein